MIFLLKRNYNSQPERNRTNKENKKAKRLIKVEKVEGKNDCMPKLKRK